MFESQKGIKRAFSLKKEDWHFSSCCAFDLYFISLNIFPRIISSLFMWNDFLWREQGIQNACFVFFFFLLFCFNKDILITYKHYRMRSKVWVRVDRPSCTCYIIMFFIYIDPSLFLISLEANQTIIIEIFLYFEVCVVCSKPLLGVTQQQ